MVVSFPDCIKVVWTQDCPAGRSRNACCNIHTACIPRPWTYQTLLFPLPIYAASPTPPRLVCLHTHMLTFFTFAFSSGWLLQHYPIEIYWVFTYMMAFATLPHRNILGVHLYVTSWSNCNHESRFLVGVFDQLKHALPNPFVSKVNWQPHVLSILYFLCSSQISTWLSPPICLYPHTHPESLAISHISSMVWSSQLLVELPVVAHVHRLVCWLL